MTHYVACLDPELIAAVKDEQRKKELHQQKHYFLLEKLQEMTRQLPGSLQMRLNYDLLSGLASCTLDKNVDLPNLIDRLKSAQDRRLELAVQQRKDLIKQFEDEKRTLTREHDSLRAELVSRPHNTQRVQNRIREETSQFKKRRETHVRELELGILKALDIMVTEQQARLEQAGVPGFFVTQDHQEIQLQIHLLDFLLRLSRIRLPDLS